MKTMTVGEFKARFSEVVSQVKAGEEIAVTFGKKKEVVGYFMPKVSSKEDVTKKRVLGPLKHIGYYMADDFCETPEEEFPISDLPL